MLDVSFSMYSEKGQIEYWNGNRFSIDEEVIVNDGEMVAQSEVQDRNDILLMLTYQVRF